MTRLVRPVILSGGSGTRLWPLSTRDQPKQFLDLVGEPLFVQALHRLDGLEGAVPPVVVTGHEQLQLVEAAIGDVDIERIVVEPVGRNTAPAVIAAAATLDPAEVMVVLPADHLIADRQGFLAAVETAVNLAMDSTLVTFGVKPSRVETGYGYIETGDRVGEGYRIARFIEKPEAKAAAAMVADGRHYWNSGMFVFKAGTLLEEARLLVPDLVANVVGALGDQVGPTLDLGSVFSEVEPVSIDVAIFEATSRARMVPLDVGWTDVGTWHSLWEASPRDAEGNVLVGDVTAIDTSASYLHATSRRLAVAGLRRMVVVDTPDGVLVVGMGASQSVRDLHPRASPTEH